MSDAPSRDIPGSPPSPIELGNAGWSILHSAAAVYPYKPTKEQKEAMKGFIYGWSHVYACNWCAYHMRRYVAEHPPVVDDKISVSRYICAFHNNVNEHVGNPTYSCDPDVLLRRWHPGYPNNMADHPSMEERVAAEEKKMEEEKRNRANSVQTPTAGRSERPTEWRSWQNNGTSSGTKAESKPAENNNSANKTSGWWGFGGGSSSKSTTDVKGAGGHGKVSDNETDVDAVLARLKGCQVYCPDNEK